MEGNYDITFHYVVKNTGSVDINFAEMQEAIDVGLVAVVGAPFFTGATTATLPPSPMPLGGYDAVVGGNDIMFSDAGVIIQPDEILDILMTVEVDPDGLNSMIPNPDNLSRFRYASNDPDAIPATPGIGYHEDLSDSGNVPESPNDGAPGASTVADDPCDNNRTDDETPVGVPDIRITKEITACVNAASGVAGNLDVTFHFARARRR